MKFNSFSPAQRICAKDRVKMAENDQEMNPRKKLKTEHNPDQNGMLYSAIRYIVLMCSEVFVVFY